MEKRLTDGSCDHGCQGIAGEENEKEHRIISCFSDALLNREFKPYIQPKYNMFDQMFYGGEVLCRWIHDGEMISPGEFIPVLEKNGLIPKLDRYMLVETLKTIRWWMNHGMNPVPLSVNLSRINFYQSNLAESILSTIDELSIPHNLIQIEITESAYVELEGTVIRFVEKMRKNGIEILMDDFGSGYSSLNMLKDIDISILKVDYKFLTKSKITSRREQILESIVKLARTINVPLIVEGVETKEDEILLKGLGVRYAQGFLYARPMPVADFDAIPKTKEIMKEHDAGYGTEMLDVLFDLTSSTHALYNNSLSGMAICEYFNGKIHIIQLNKAMQNSSDINLNDLKHQRRNLLDYVAKSDKDRVIQYIEEVCDQSQKAQFIEFDYDTPIATIHLKMMLSLLMQRENEYVLLMDVMKMHGDRASKGEYSLFDVLDQIDRGYYIMDKDHKILYSNPKVREILPHFVPGVKCTDYKRYDEDCSQCPLDNLDVLLSYYSQNLEAFMENYITMIKLNGEAVKLVRADMSRTEVLANNDSVMRMNRAMARENDVYTEVELDSLSYNQVTFAKRKIFDVPTHGEYTTAFAKMIEKRIDKKTNAELIYYFSSEGMRREYVNGKRIRARFKFADIDAWAECVGTFIQDGEKRYCCVYTRDVTKDIERDYDRMTGALNGEVSKKFMNEYFVEHADKRAALFLFDFDNFKKINDACGHAVGDAVLIAFAKMLKTISSNVDYASRLSGDEFLVFVKDLPSDFKTEKFGEEILQKVQSIYESLGVNNPATVSIGAALYPADGQTYDELFLQADERMYLEKEKKKLQKLQESGN